MEACTTPITSRQCKKPAIAQLRCDSVGRYGGIEMELFRDMMIAGILGIFYPKIKTSIYKLVIAGKKLEEALKTATFFDDVEPYADFVFCVVLYLYGRNSV